jgi:hypothetical protein
MKNRLIILIITACIVFQLALLEGYDTCGGTCKGFKSTAAQEDYEHENIINHDHTTNQSEITECKKLLNNAEITGQAEVVEEAGLHNAQSTIGQENTERSWLSDEAQLMPKAEEMEIKERVVNAQVTSQEEKRERSGTADNVSRTERLEREARQDSH